MKATPTTPEPAASEEQKLLHRPCPERILRNDVTLQRAAPGHSRMRMPMTSTRMSNPFDTRRRRALLRHAFPFTVLS